jgi:hypothetical protein
MALQHPDIEVAAITVVSGNVPVRQGSVNARYTVELCGKNAPVYQGAESPLKRDSHIESQSIHLWRSGHSAAGSNRNGDRSRSVYLHMQHAAVCWGIDVKRWKEMLYSLL